MLTGAKMYCLDVCVRQTKVNVRRLEEEIMRTGAGVRCLVVHVMRSVVDAMRSVV